MTVPMTPEAEAAHRPCARFWGSDGTFCATHNGRFLSPSETRCTEARWEPCPYCGGRACPACGTGYVGPNFRANRGLPPYPEAEAAHREPGGGLREAAQAVFDLVGTPGLGLSNEPVVRALGKALREREAAHRDSLDLSRFVEGLVAHAGDCGHTECVVTHAREALAAEPIAASRNVARPMTTAIAQDDDPFGGMNPTFVEVYAEPIAASSRLDVERAEAESLRAALARVVAVTNGSHDTMLSHDHSKCLPWALEMARATLEGSHR